jgi:hypothetical protein
MRNEGEEQSEARGEEGNAFEGKVKSDLEALITSIELSLNEAEKAVFEQVEVNTDVGATAEVTLTVQEVIANEVGAEARQEMRDLLDQARAYLEKGEMKAAIHLLEQATRLQEKL